MSEGYAHETALVSEEANYYDRALDTTIALAVVCFLLGLVTLAKLVGLETSGAALTDFLVKLLLVGVGGVGTVGLFSALNVVSLESQRVRGIGLGLVVSLVGLAALSTVPGLDLETLLGVVLVVEGVAIGAAGVLSRAGVVDTEPSASAGLLAGTMFGAVGFVIGIALKGVVFGPAVPAWVAGLGMALVFAALTVLPREDLGTTLPAALLVALLGVVAAVFVGTGFEWKPDEPLNGGLTGSVVLSLFFVLGAILAGWAAAKARARYGARGRQYGSFLVIYLNAVMTVVVMVFIVVFVLVRGLNYTFHGFTIGAVSALVVLAPLLVLALSYARRPAGSPEWNSAVRQAVRVLPLAATGAVAAFLVSIVVTGEAFEVPFTYQVLVNRQEQTLETAAAVTPETTVGTLVLLAPGLLVFGYFFRKYNSLSGVGSRLDRQPTVERALGLGVAGLLVLSVLFAVLSQQPFGLPLGDPVGLVAVGLAALATGGLALAAVGRLLVGDGSLAERAHERAQTVKVGLFGSLGLLAAAVVLQPAAGVNPAAGPADLVPVVAATASVAALGVAGLAASARRSVSAGAAEGRLRRRVLAEEVRLGLAAATGFVVLVALHVAMTGSAFTVGGLTVGFTGTLSWPMTMVPQIPLGAEPGGILPAVVGTVWLIVGASLFAIPLGVGAAVFLTEYAEQGKFTALVETATNALWSTPSVVFGLFGAAFLIPRIGADESIMSAMLVLGFMLLPLVLITSREAIKSVPDQYRDASAALGVGKWETIRSVVLPAAIPGVITGVILGVGRIAGETAPLILVLGVGDAGQPIDVLGSFQFIAEPPFIYNGALLEASRALPKQVWAVIAAGVSGSPSKGWGTAVILLAVVLSFYLVGILTRRYFRRKLDYE